MTLESSSSSASNKLESNATTSDTELSNFLWQSPLVFNCHFDEAAKQAILLRCYQALWMNDETVMQQCFFPSHQDLQDSLSYQCARHDGKEQHVVNDPSLWHTNAILPNQDLSSQKGRQCGHVFRKGEPVYRCRNCGLDDTCVFCSKCFHATNHDGHDILFSVSPGSGGCCDCGDPEAWKVPLQCNIHTSDNSRHNTIDDTPGTERDALDPKLIHAMRNTIASVLNFLLDTFALAPDEVALNASTEDLVRENQEQRNILSRMGIPAQLPNNNNNNNNNNSDTDMENVTPHTEAAAARLAAALRQEEEQEDIDMDKENATHIKLEPVDTEQEEEEAKKDGELYACIAWNDEAHAFSHVLESIMTATGWDWDKAKQIVDVIHVHGREIIAVSQDIAELRKIAAPLSAINLGVTIRPAKETFREQVCGLLVDWLNELVNGRNRFFQHIDNGDAVIRNMVCEELCAEWELRLPLALLTTGVRASNAAANEDGDEDDDDEGDMKDDSIAASVVVEDVEMLDPESDAQHSSSSKPGSPASFSSSPIIYRNQCDVASIDWDPAAMVREYQDLRHSEVAFGESLLDTNAVSETALGKKPVITTMDDSKQDAQAAMAIQKEFEEKLRLDYFMLYDLKLWKEVRISLRELYIASLASNPRFKKILGKRLARNYARLAESFLLRDREPENSIILFSVQLLTVPTVSDLLVHNYYFFGLICSTLTAFFLTDRLYLLLPSERSKYPSRINCESRAFRTRRYFNAFHDLRYIMNVEMIKSVLAQDPLYLGQYLDLISLFQGMNAQVCQKDTHVEYESEIWVNAFNVTLQIAKCCRQFSDCFNTLPSATEQDKINTATTVVHAINRILKKIMEWGQLDEAEETAEREKNLTVPAGPVPAQKIFGAAAQTFHTISLGFSEPFQVIKYNVATQPVSFHHPLHWLLSGLLEYAHLLNDDVLRHAGWEGGFKQIITLFNGNKTAAASPNVLLPILDYPVRTIVFSSQIRAGVWVRNGYGIRNQAHHYRDISLRESTYDADVFLLQLGFATLPPNRFLATLLDRFDLVKWFLGNKTHDNYDASQTVFMVEELLNLLIVVACERANISGMSITDKIRREIIHNLCLGSSAYSDLTKRIPERITEHPEFDRILASVAHFKSPDGVNDHGSYELKEEHFAHVDTYFWHFSRNNREEAESILKARWKKAHPHEKEEDFFILPRHVPIAPGPFQHLGSFLQSTVFVQMLAFALWNVYTGDHHKSDTILDQIMYLILLALQDQNSEDVSNYGQGKFYDHVCSLQFEMEVPSATADEKPATRHMSLFDIMAELYPQEQYNEVTSRFNWVFEQLGTKGVHSTRATVEAWRAQHAAKVQQDAQKQEENGGISEMSEMEKKKLAAQERQKKIMAQFAQAQTQFMEQNEFLYEDEDEEEAFVSAPENPDTDNEDSANAETLHQFCAYPTGTCIVCQEDANDRSLPYGLLGLIQTSNIMRETPMDDTAVFNDMCRMGSNLDVEWQDRQCMDDNDTNAADASVPGFPAQMHKTGLYASSCGHFMHIKCFEVYCTSIDSRHSAQLTRNHPENRSRKEFMCPLCKSLGNALLPVFWKGKKETFPGVLVKANDDDFSQFYKHGVNQIVSRLKHIIVTASRHAQSRKSGKESSATSRMKDVMAQFLPALPLTATNTAATTPGAATITPAAAATATATTTATPDTTPRDWATMRFPTRLPITTPLDTAPGAATATTAATPTNAPVQATGETTGQQDADFYNTNQQDTEQQQGTTSITMQKLLASDAIPLPDGHLGPFDNETLHSTSMVSAPLIKKSYERLLDVLGIIYQEICTDDNEREMSTAAQNVDMLWGIMGYTIAGIEIASRGAPAAVSREETTATHTLFDQIAPQTQMLLRILSDTVMAYTTLMCPWSGQVKSSPAGVSMARVSMFSLGRMRQMFEISVDDVANLPAGPSQKIVLYDNAPILQDDPFMILTELSLHLVPMAQADIFPFVRTLLLAEFAKTAVGLLQDRLQRPAASDQAHTAPSEPSQNIAAAKAFAFSLMNKLHFTHDEAVSSFHKFDSEASFCALLKFFALPFLRRTLILMIVRFGLIIPPATAMETDPAADELDRLMNILHLPKFADFLQPTHMSESLLHHWCAQHVRESERRIQLQDGLLSSMSARRLISISLDLPTPIYLVALPKRLDRLFDESMKRVCKKCGTVPSDPALCLFCGTFVCAQSFCCAEDEEGECNLHTLECGGEIGAFLSVKRCVLILLHNGNGWFMNAPYLDPHGEVDQGLRHGRPQYLNAKRYAEIRKLWLQHNIPIYVARQIEANYDIGGWTTL
ncbi:conserved hypothetical protein [Mucor ambiguus]|uniref:E3 ubiquitin-protein ligase n=1 Tax=Mucor ambiguus TaxID=91626 RepID=A0A0C9MNJ7_9FUNG|nr:conserved hypothetical protein [Mucor ambiguus]